MNVAGFKLYLIGRGIRKTSVSHYITVFQTVCKNAPNLTEEEIITYFSKLIDLGNKNSYINNMSLVLRLYGQYIKDKKFKKFKSLKVERPIKSTMSDKEIAAFLDLPCDRQDSIGYDRWTLFFKICAYSGMRPGEVASLTVNNIDFGRGVFTPSGKTGFRYVPIAPILIPELTEYIKSVGGNYLFPAKREGSIPTIQRETWRQNFYKRLAILGIKRQGLTTHSLRHSFITRMLDEDVNLFKVQKIVGHNNIKTTAMYTHLTTKDITKAIARDPLSRKDLAYIERFKQFREGVRQLLEEFAKSPEEEKQMLDSL